MTVQAEYEVRVQLLEIYNEQLRDLLDSRRSGRRLEIRNTERSGLNVPEATQVCPSCQAPKLAFQALCSACIQLWRDAKLCVICACLELPDPTAGHVVLQ